MKLLRISMLASALSYPITYAIAIPTRLGGYETNLQSPKPVFPRHEMGGTKGLMDPYLDYYENVDPAEILGE